MNIRTILKKLGILVTHSGVSAATSAMTNAIGASILTNKYEGHDILESVTIASSGAALLGAVLDLSFNMCITGSTPYAPDLNERGVLGMRLLWSYLFTQLLGPVLGRIMFSSSDFPTMSYAQYEADAGVGMAVSIFPICLILCCITHSNYASPEDAFPEDAYQRLPDGEEKGLTYRGRLDKCYEGKIPEDYLSALTLTLMNDPIMLHCGHNFDKEDVTILQKRCAGKCPCCREPLRHSDFTLLKPNVFLRKSIIEFVESKEKLVPKPQIIEISQEEKVEIAVDTFTPTQQVIMNQTNQQKLQQLNIPIYSVNKTYICPLTKTIMDDPVRASDNNVYEKSALIIHISNQLEKQSPVLSPTGEVLEKIKGDDWFQNANDVKELIIRFFRAKSGRPISRENNSIFLNVPTLVAPQRQQQLASTPTPK